MRFAQHRRLVIAIAGSGVVLLVLVIIGVYGLLRPPGTASQQDRPASEASVASAPPTPAHQPKPVRETSRPELFVRRVAEVLFRWDTRTDTGPSEWAQALVDVANPAEAAGVASDVRGYLPGTEMWERLRAYGTRQWLEVDSVTVPETWSTALEQAASGQIPRGAAAFTVVGTRHRAGTWDTEGLRTEQLASFTVFVVCTDGQPCTLLRLSQLDHPLK
jgi:hypothetical protein